MEFLLIVLVSILLCRHVYANYESLSQQSLEPQKLLTTLKTLPKEYVIAFEVFLTSSNSTYWTNIVHFTIGGDYRNYGDRTPSISFKAKEIQVCSSVNGNNLFCVYSKTLELMKWIKVKVSQLLENGNYNHTVQIDQETVSTCINTQPQEFTKVKIFASNPWVPSQPGYIRNLVVTYACSESDTNFKPPLNVLFHGTLFENMLNLTLQIRYMKDSCELAVNVTWQYFLPIFLKFESDSAASSFEKVDLGNLKYMILHRLNSNGANHTIVTELLNTSCTSGIYSVDVSMKLSFQNSCGNSWSLYQTVKKNISENCKEMISPQKYLQKIYQSEYYRRGIYWNNESSRLYLCRNQNVPSEKTACYFTEDNGASWKGMDVRIGCILGHHTSTRELYAIHKNQITYLVYHSTFKKWLAVTDNDFKTKISSNLNWNLLKIIENDYDQIVTFGTNQWMGNIDGLFFKDVSNNIWVQRFRWYV
ncbi:uncharacterized protein LOC124818937 [Hydra vulgaris]|uniref:uncharacterized protein LOC124818937 n=1 Tax=Hydra vulgaris TaxID=6087 RepID=UPI001F5F595B|nr:uncharacterized protein LOC124818937 [Hydra vulgaris]